MVSWLELATDYGIATAIGVVMNQIAKRIFPSDTIKGDPRWVYYLSIFTQTFIFPPLCLLSWRENNFEFSSWYNQPWATLPSIAFNRAYMAALWGYWAKDMFVLSDPLIVIHHIFCMSSLLVSASIRELGGLGFIVCGTAALELGTVWYNLSTLFSNKPAFRYMYWTVLSLSNIVSPALAVWFYNEPKYPFYARLWYVITVFGLAIGRQREMILDLMRSSEEGKQKKIKAK